ncbi:hypothetical protein DPMN_191385 [Dreissena polymorpha]|uniref:Uncharacterized protein n=1 Tax=Dreissena polymorpha TaxID=45954 RepID=A0A9D3Y477_DREPO|nr:hypothetical protein DPMN_191385 [Dreissena polymorpha]
MYPKRKRGTAMGLIASDVYADLSKHKQYAPMEDEMNSFNKATILHQSLGEITASVKLLASASLRLPASVSVKLLATASAKLLASSKPLALRQPLALGEASVTALYDVRRLQPSEDPLTIQQELRSPMLIRSHTQENCQLADLRVFLYWRT